MIKYILAGTAATAVAAIIGVVVLKKDLACEYSPIDLSTIIDCEALNTVNVADAKAKTEKTTTENDKKADEPSVEVKVEAETKLANIEAEKPAESEAIAEKTLPTFDIVRVEPDGSTLVAGRGAPNSTIILKSDEKNIGEAVASETGEWVIVVDEPIKNATATLSLLGMMPDGTTVESPATVDIAMRKEAEPAAKATPTTDTAAEEKTNEEKTVVKLADANIKAVETVVKPTAKVLEQSADIVEEIKIPATEIATENTAPLEDKTPLVVVSEEGKATKILQGAGTGSENNEMTFNSMDYNNKGEIIFSGDAKPNEIVRVYVNNKFVGEAKADAAGRWALDKGYIMQAGPNEMRFDQVDATGIVLSRRETSINMPELDQATAAKTAETVVTANSDDITPKALETKDAEIIETKAGRAIIIWGDNLWNISRKIYGKGELYTTIFKANKDQIRNPDLIYPGQVFLLPENIDLELENVDVK